MAVGGGAGLGALLPCKPDRASRDLPLGSQSVAVTMIGCEAGGATFAVAQASSRDVAQGHGWRPAWQAQARAAQGAGGSIREEAATVPRAAAAPAPLHIDAKAPAGQRIQQLWFAHAQRNGAISIYQATVLGTPSAPEAAQTFFEGLRLP